MQRRWVGVVVGALALLGACGGGDDGEASPETTAAATSVAPTTAPGTTAATAASTTAPATTAPATSAPTTAPATTVDDGASGGGSADPGDVAACTLLDVTDIEEVLGGPVSEPVDLGTACEWEVGEGDVVPDTLTLTVEGPAEGLADTRDLLGDDGIDVPEAGDGGVYWADFSTLYFTTGGRQLSLQFLAFGTDDPLGGLVALANRVG